jgi:nucleotide-binding universal stress UspA family protein
MKILFAHQGWPTPEAIAFAACHPWPQGTAFRVVAVMEPDAAAFSSFAGFSEIKAETDEVRRRMEDGQAGVLVRLAERGWSVAAELPYGRAMTRISAAASEFDADLMIVSPRLAAPGIELDVTLARDLLETSPCPVIVARRHSISRVVFATDGSPGARTAEMHLVESPVLAGLPILVVSVAETRSFASAKLLRPFGEFDEREVAKRLAQHQDHASAAAARLAGHGLDVTVETRTGDVAAEIAAAVSESAADLVVIGSDDHRGLSRIILGSVARELLAQVDASLLVVRMPAPAFVVALKSNPEEHLPSAIERVAGKIAPSTGKLA